MTTNGIPITVRFGGVILLSLACFWVAFEGKSCYGQHQVDSHVQQADVDHVNAVVYAQEGAKDDTDELKAKAEVARLKAKLAQVQASIPVVQPIPVPTSPVVGGDNSQPGAGYDVPGASSLPTPDPEKALLRELVAAQDVQIKTLTLSRDAWRSSAQASAAEAVQVRAALTAQQGVSKAQRWLGRAEGFAVGFGLGYAGGKFR